MTRAGTEMPQIEIPFTTGQRVRTADGSEFAVGDFEMRVGLWLFCEPAGRWWAASALTLVEPVIEWERPQEESWRAAGWVGGDWKAFDNGALWYGCSFIGIFPNPRAVAEQTQEMWNKEEKEPTHD